MTIKTNSIMIDFCLELDEIRKGAIHQTWSFSQYLKGIKITGIVHEISAQEITELLIKYSSLYYTFNLENKYIYIFPI